MGHEGFVKFLLAAMGNVISALLMYALQAAWLCQRLIDQDYRQNHGSRMTPVADNKNASKSIEIISTSPELILQKNGHCRIRHYGQGSKSRKQFEGIKMESSKSHRSSKESRRHKCNHRNRPDDEMTSKRKLYLSHPYLEKVTNVLTIEYMNGLDQALGLRRAFSDINLSSKLSQFKEESCKKSFNCLTNFGPADDATALSVSDKDYIRLIHNKSYVT